MAERSGPPDSRLFCLIQQSADRNGTEMAQKSHIPTCLTFGSVNTFKAMRNAIYIIQIVMTTEGES